MAIQPHVIDKIIGDEKRSAFEIAKSISESSQFLEIVERAVESSEELPPGMCGASFSQQVRVAIANNLLNQE
jgi:hypothetical protein